MKIKIRTVQGQTHTFDDVADGATVADLKARIAPQLEVPLPLQRLIFAGRELTAPDETLASNNIVDGCTIHLVVRQAPALDQGQPGSGAAAQPGQDFVAVPVDQGQINVDILMATLSEQGYATLQLARTIKMFAIIDCVFLLLFSLNMPEVLAAIVMPLAGYLGAAYFRVLGLYIYGVYVIAIMALRAYLNSISTTNAFFLILNTFGIILEALILFLTQKLVYAIKSMSSEQVNILRAIERNRS